MFSRSASCAARYSAWAGSSAAVYGPQRIGDAERHDGIDAQRHLVETS
jgi:hypothetical protein